MDELSVVRVPVDEGRAISVSDVNVAGVGQQRDVGRGVAGLAFLAVFIFRGGRMKLVLLGRSIEPPDHFAV